jgi:DNA-binding XRE family transcriptional regulator
MQSGVGQLSAAKVLGIKQASYSRIENGKIVPNINQVLLLCEFFDYDFVVYAKIHSLLENRVRIKFDGFLLQNDLDDYEVLGLIKSELIQMVKESLV